MKNGLIAFCFIVLLWTLASCSLQPDVSSNSQETTNITTNEQGSDQGDVIDMDSDYSIEKHLGGLWTWTDGTTKCTLDFEDETKTATWVIYGFTFSGNYRVSGRQIICDMHSEKTAPQLFVHELTQTSLEITGVGRIPITVRNMTFTKE